MFVYQEWMSVVKNNNVRVRTWGVKCPDIHDWDFVDLGEVVLHVQLGHLAGHLEVDHVRGQGPVFWLDQFHPKVWKKNAKLGIASNVNWIPVQNKIKYLRLSKKLSSNLNFQIF